MTIPRAVRTSIFWCHLAIGAIVGVVIFVMSVTGGLLAYQRHILAWADAAPAVTPPGGSAVSPLSVETLADSVHASMPAASVTSVTISADLQRPAFARLGNDGVVYLDPYSGQVLSVGSQRTRTFFHTVEGIHRWLGFGGSRYRAVGRVVTGACTLALGLLLVSGLILWWPRHWSRRRFRAVTMFSWRLHGKARHFNWHNVAGIWSAPVLLCIVITGVCISYQWPLRAMDRVGVLQSLPMPVNDGRTVRFTSDEGAVANRPDHNSLHQSESHQRSSGRRRPAVPDESSRRLRSWVRAVHTGRAGGVMGETVALLAALLAMCLVYTGLSLAWRRLVYSRGRRQRTTPA